MAKNKFKVLEVDEKDEEEVVNVRQVENSERTDSVVCVFEDGKAKNRVQFVNSVIKASSWTRLRTNRAGQWGKETLSRRRKAGGRCC